MEKRCHGNKMAGKPGNAGNPAKYVKMQEILHDTAPAPALPPRPSYSPAPPRPRRGRMRSGYAVKAPEKPGKGPKTGENSPGNG